MLFHRTHGDPAAPLSNDGGFTFLEVLIALSILAVVGLGSIQMIQDGQFSQAHDRMIERAGAEAVLQLIELEGDGLNGIMDRAGSLEDSGLKWTARAYATGLIGVYRMEVCVFEDDTQLPLVTLEKFFIERF